MPLKALAYILATFLLICLLPIIGASCAGTGGGGQPADSAAQQQQGGQGGGGGGVSPAPNVGSPQSIALKSDKTQVNVRDVGGDSVASITATVVDGLGRAVPGSNVIFTISGAASGGGATIESPKVTDSNGDASTKFTAGTVSGTLIITAQVSGTSVQAAYSQLTVNAGPPNVISMSRSPANIDGLGIDAVESTVSVIIPDKYGNPVKNATPVYFSTDYCIVEAMCTTTNGACSVKFRSSEVRPPGANSFATITSTTSGQSSQISDTTPILLSGAGASFTVDNMPPG
ncbi:MAG: Ig-like domain-containing protein, partial [Armatimonadetes bacterium]|nr:Ig-like domain-containing protein [Armatimonadota bacterium]